MDICERPKQITCPIDNKKKTVYLRILIHDNKEFVSSNGCDDARGDKRCEACISKEFKITDLSPVQDNLSQ